MRYIKIILIIFILLSICLLGCVKSTMSPSSGILNSKKESRHFIIRYNKSDEGCIKDVLKTFEDNYDRITGNLKWDLKDKVEVKVYPDLKEFHKAYGDFGAPEWLVGCTRGGVIMMVSPMHPGKEHNYDSVIKVTIHEFTHVVEGKLTKDIGSLPLWLNEGVAVYEARQYSSGVREMISDGVRHNNIPSLHDMEGGRFADIGGYQYSYTIVEYIINNYGYDKLIKLIESYRDIKDILGVSEEDFEKGWRDYLYKNYK